MFGALFVNSPGIGVMETIGLAIGVLLAIGSIRVVLGGESEIKKGFFITIGFACELLALSLFFGVLFRDPS